MQKENFSSLIIAGSDSGAGAGIQGDLKTFSFHGVYASTVITALTAQNTLGVDAVYNIPAHFIEKQLKSITSDFKIRYVKSLVSGSNVNWIKYEVHGFDAIQ